jgi:hypothetical protein
MNSRATALLRHFGELRFDERTFNMSKLFGAMAIVAMLAAAVVATNSSIAAQSSEHAVRAGDSKKRVKTSTHATRHVKKSHSTVNQRKAAETKGYKKLSSLVNFPEFFPGLGIIYVKPDTLPLGPFLCFDRKDHLVATVYMIPTKDIEDRKTFENLTGLLAKGDHVSLYFNSGHPGVEVPHYHFVVWHVAKKDEAHVAQ